MERPASVFLVLFLTGLGSVLARQENFCKPLEDWGDRYDLMENVTVCRTKLEKKCEEVTSRAMCLNVTEINCKVELFPNCTMDWHMEDGMDFEMIMKNKTLKECEKKMVPEQHNKTIYECKNVTKQHCTTIWKVNDRGEKIWAGEADDCRNVTWEECHPIIKNVTMMVPTMMCEDVNVTYPSFINITTTVKVDTMDCQVEKRAVCHPVESRKCSTVNFTKCTQETVKDCKPVKEVVPYQDVIHKQWCLLDHKKNIDFESEIRKLTGNPINFPFEKVAGLDLDKGRKARNLNLNVKLFDLYRNRFIY